MSICRLGAFVSLSGPRPNPLREAIPEDAFGLPRLQLAELFGKGVRVSGELESFDREDCRRRMVTVSSAGHGGKARNKHIRSKLTDDTHNIGQHLIAIPDAECFTVIFGKSEVDGPREKLLAAVNAPGGQ